MAMDGKILKSKRVAAGIAGHVLCKKLGIARSRLSDIERGYITPAQADLTRIDTILDELICAKAVIQETAAAVGWPTQDVA